MSILFISDNNNPIILNSYEYFSKKYDCKYNDTATNADIIITDHYINLTNKKIIYYATNNNFITGDIAKRRVLLGWFKNCEVVCASWVIAKMFNDTFRIKPSVQHPYVPKKKVNQSNVCYSNKFNDIEAIRKEISSENFVMLDDPHKITESKIYLASSSLFVDLATCFASSYGVPVISENSPYIQEFLDKGDVVLTQGIPLNQKIQIIKKALKEFNNLKVRSNRFVNQATMDDKIKQALSKKPTTITEVVNTTMSGPKSTTMSGPRRLKPIPPTQINFSQNTIIKPVKANTLFVTGSVVGFSGYDLLVKEVIRGLKSINVDVRINSYSDIRYNICPSYFREIHCIRPLDAWEIVIIPPCSLDRQGQSIGKKTVVFTMWETDHLEPHWVKQLNNAAFVVVPSQWAVESFQKSGVKVPIYKVPLGYDPVNFNFDGGYPLECIFGTAAALNAGGLRKNTSYVVDLFQKAFPNNEKAKLKVKITKSCPWKEIDDPRVEVINTFLTTEQLAAWYKSIGVFVNCSYAEGFGLHLIEAMACGRPIISTAYSAVTEYFDESVGYVVDHEIIKASGKGIVPYHGHWAKPLDESIIKHMRHVYENRNEAQAKGQNAAIRAKSFMWKNMGQKLFSLLKENGIVV